MDDKTRSPSSLNNALLIKATCNNQHTLQRLIVTLGEEQHGLGRSLRCLQESLSVGVLTQGSQQQSVGCSHVGQECLSGGGLVVQLQVIVEGAFLVTWEQEEWWRDETKDTVGSQVLNNG